MANIPIWYFYTNPSRGPILAAHMQTMIDDGKLPLSHRIRFTDSVDPKGKTLCYEATIGYILARFGTTLPWKLSQMGLRGTFISNENDEYAMQKIADKEEDAKRQKEEKDRVQKLLEGCPLTYFFKTSVTDFSSPLSPQFVRQLLESRQVSRTQLFCITDNGKTTGELFTILGSLLQFEKRFGNLVPETVREINLRGWYNLSQREKRITSARLVVKKDELPLVQATNKPARGKLTYFVKTSNGRFSAPHSAMTIREGYFEGRIPITTKFRVTDSGKLNGDRFTVEGTLFQFFARFGTEVPMTPDEINAYGLVILSDQLTNDSRKETLKAVNRQTDRMKENRPVFVDSKSSSFPQMNVFESEWDSRRLLKRKAPKPINIVLNGRLGGYAQEDPNKPPSIPATSSSHVAHSAIPTDWTPVSRPKMLATKQQPAYSSMPVLKYYN